VVSDIEAHGASLVVISPQLAKYSKQVARKHHLTFSVLGDKGNALASQFGLVHRLPEDMRGLYGALGIDLERFNGDDSWALPMPGRFVVKPQGVIVSADASPDHTRRPEPSDIMGILKTL